MSTFLVWLDNGGFYDDHHKSVLCAASTQQAAENEVTRLKEWVAHVRTLPKPEEPRLGWPDEDKDSEEMKRYDAAWAAYYPVRAAFFASLNCPYVSEGLINMGMGHGRYTFIITEVPTL